MTPTQLSKLRKKRGLSQGKLAELINGYYRTAKGISCNMQRENISGMETGRNPVAWYVAKYFEETE